MVLKLFLDKLKNILNAKSMLEFKTKNAFELCFEIQKAREPN